MKQRSKEEGGGRNSILRAGAIVLIVPCSLLLVPLLTACKPKPADAPTVSEKMKALEAKTEKAVEAAKEKIEGLEERFSRERAEFAARFDAQLKRTEAGLAKLKQRAELDASRRPELERGIQALEARSKALRERIQQAKSATKDQWDQIKAPWQKKEGYEDYEEQILKETET